MKKILLLVLFSGISFLGFSQTGADYNYSIGLRAYSLVQMPKVLDEMNTSKFTNAPFSGVLVKFNDNQISYRISGFYYEKSWRFYNNCETCQEAIGKMVDYTFKVGFEKNLNYSVFQPYFGLDLGFKSNRFTGNLENRNTLKSDAGKASVVADAANSSDQTIASKNGLIISPLIGFKINPISQISLFAEGNLDFFYSYERQEVVVRDVNNTKTFHKYTKTEFLLNPVSVGILIHLGSNK